MKPYSLAQMLAQVRLLAAIITLGLTGFVTSVPTAMADTLTYQPGPYQGKDAWISSYYDYGSNYGVDDVNLRVGGWGDLYWSIIRPDLNGLPANVSKVELKLYCLPNSGGATTVGMKMYRVANTTWTEEEISATNGRYYTSPAVSLTAPTAGSWYTIDITTWYRNWKSGAWINDGLWLTPTANNNRFNNFISSDYSNPAYRPKLAITFTQPYQSPSYPTSIRMPLPSGKSWLLTTEIGGTDCFGIGDDPANPDERDPAHYGTTNGEKYFALDIAPVTTGGVYQNSVAVLSVADGYVVAAGYDSANGNYVSINHSYIPSSGSTLFNINKGLVSTYIHMKNPTTSQPRPVVGAKVYQGTKIGVVGNTGNPTTGEHLHVVLKFNGAGLGLEELATIQMEGIPLKQYQTECTECLGNDWDEYYRSTNTQR